MPLFTATTREGSGLTDHEAMTISIDDLCTEIGTLPSSERGGACKVSNSFVHACNGDIRSCSGPQTKKFGGGACDE